MSKEEEESKSEKESKDNSLDVFDGLTRDQIFDLQQKNISITDFDPKCIRQKSNWSKASKVYQLDSGIFNPNQLSAVIPDYSPKLDTLLQKIEKLDRKDEIEFGHTFKHFIFSDLKSGVYGAKLIASALLSNGWTLGYKAEIKRNIKHQEDADAEEERKEKIWGPTEMLSDSELAKTKGQNFYLLASTSVYDEAISIKMKKEILSRFNARPDNIYGENTRIIVMDSGFKEGIDLFDIKYIHIFEPSVNPADQKQVIGRGTRTCGQKGLPFDSKQGWPLHVFIYDLEIPDELQKTLLSSDTAFELYKKVLDLDTRLLNFNYDIERVLTIGSVDYELNMPVHKFSIKHRNNKDSSMTSRSNFFDSPAVSSLSDSFSSAKKGGAKHIRYDSDGNIRSTMGYHEMQHFIQAYYKQFLWKKVKMENLCISKEPSKESQEKNSGAILLTYTPSQDFIRHFFSPQAPVKGILMNWSVGTGKTAAAIAAASRNFEPAGYTILWVTRATLKNDIWKNMFNQVANESIREKIQNGFSMPKNIKDQMKLLGKSWRIRPISYKQFSNLILKQNEYYERLVRENGKEDPLRKTLLIIDEAHKLYGGGDLSTIERPDMNALHTSLMHSYAVSGEDSCRLLLMTATPITENPIELVQLVNLCKLPEEQMPHTFESFSDDYLDENGNFTNKGEYRFLNDIAGHISYLNREKDARQFAQPIIKKVNCPIVSEKNIELVKNFDKFLAKSSAVESLYDKKQELQLQNDRLNGELKEVGKERFTHLKDMCDDIDIPTKYCKKIIQQNIKTCLQEIKEYITSIKEKAKKLREEIKLGNTYKTNELKRITDMIKANPEKFEKYKNSAYFTLRNTCSFRITTIKELRDHFDEYPEVKILNQNIQKNKDSIILLKNQIVVLKESYRFRVRQLHEFIKLGDLSDLEKISIRRSLIDLRKEHNKTMKNTKKKVNKEISDTEGVIKEIEKERKGVYRKLRTSLKKISTIKKKELNKEKKEEMKVRKLSRRQGILQDAIQDESIQEIADKYIKKIDKELMNVGMEIAEEVEEKEKEKDAKKQAKLEAKNIKAQIREAEKTRKRLEKEAKKGDVKTKKALKKEEKKIDKEEKKVKNQVKVDITSKIAQIKALASRR